MGRPKNLQIWAHYRETENKSATCNHCEKRYTIANLQKMARHLLKCLNCPENSKQEIRTNSWRSSRSGVLLQGSADKENVNPESELDLSFQTTATSNKNVNALPDATNQNLHSLLAKAIYVSGTPLSIVENPLWIQFIQTLQPLYKLPTRKTLSTSILDKTYNNMYHELKDEITSQPCLHLQLDGWSNCRNEGIFNVLVSKPEPVFVKSFATEENQHTGEYISNLISNVLSEYGPNKFVTMIGDNASNIQRSFRLVKEMYPHLTYLNCAAHTLNLLCKDIMKIDVIYGILNIVTNIIKAIKTRQVLVSLLAKLVKEKGAGETLKLPCDTRWGTYCTSFKSVENTKVALQTLAVHEKASILPSEEKSALLDENMWKIIRECIQILEPISDSIFQLESNKENIHKVFLTLKNMKSKLMFSLPDISILDDDTRNEILIKTDRRINMCLKPIHFAAYLLDPEAQGAELDESQELDAMEFINEIGQHIGIDVFSNLASYRARDGFWSRRFIWENVNSINPSTWWKGICGSSALSKIAVRILTAPCTSAATERSFSAYSNIHSNKKNRLTNERAAKLTYISYNWNLKNKLDTIEEEDDECMSDLSATTQSPATMPPPRSQEEDECMSDLSATTQSPATMPPPRSCSPQPSGSGMGNFEYYECDNISFSSDDDE